MARTIPIPSPPLGPFCCFTGRSIRPWPFRLLHSVLHAAVVIGLPFLALYALGASVGPGPALSIGALGSLIYLGSLFSPRLHVVLFTGVFTLAAWATVHSFGIERPLALSAEDVPSPVRGLDTLVQNADDFFLQAAKISAFTFGAGVLALLCTLPLISTAIQAWKSRNLPRRLWFAKFHPVWRRRYAPEEGPHPLIGLVYVASDPLLAEKLLWLKLDRDTRILRFGRNGDPLRAPLAALEREVVLFREARRWHATDALSEEGPVQMRLFLDVAHPAGLGEIPVAATSAAANLPVRDLFAADNGYFAKTYAETQNTVLLGVLVDSRPNLEGVEPALPRFTLLLARNGELHVEYPHTDLLGRAYLEEEARVVHLPWRGDDDEAFDLQLTVGQDSVHQVGTGEQPYYLLFTAFHGSDGGSRWA